MTWERRRGGRAEHGYNQKGSLVYFVGLDVLWLRALSHLWLMPGYALMQGLGELFFCFYVIIR